MANSQGVDGWPKIRRMLAEIGETEVKEFLKFFEADARYIENKAGAEPTTAATPRTAASDANQGGFFAQNEPKPAGADGSGRPDLSFQVGRRSCFLPCFRQLQQQLGDASFEPIIQRHTRR